MRTHRRPRAVHPHPPHKRQALAPTSHQSKTAAPTTTWHTVPQGVKALPKHRYRDLSFPLAVDREARRWAGVLGGGQCTTNPDAPFFCLRPRKLRSSRRLLSDEGVQPHGPARHAREHACSLSMHVVHALIRTSCLAASRRARGGVATRGRPLL